MKGLTGSEIVVILALKKKRMTFHEIDTLLQDPSFGEPSKTTQHWVELLENKKLILREFESIPIFCLTTRGDTKADEFIRAIGQYVPNPVVLM